MLAVKNNNFRTNSVNWPEAQKLEICSSGSGGKHYKARVASVPSNLISDFTDL